MGAGGRQGARHRPAEMAAGGGDEGDFAVETEKLLRHLCYRGPECPY